MILTNEQEIREVFCGWLNSYFVRVVGGERMSDEKKKLEEGIDKKKETLSKDSTVSPLIRKTLIDLIDTVYKLSNYVIDLEDRIEDVKEGLNDPESHDMR